MSPTGRARRPIRSDSAPPAGRCHFICKRPVSFSITHNLGSQLEAEQDVVEPGEPAPDDRIAARRVVRPGQVAAQLGHRQQLVGDRPLDTLRRTVRDAIQEGDLGRGERHFGQGRREPPGRSSSARRPASRPQTGRPAGWSATRPCEVWSDRRGTLRLEHLVERPGVPQRRVLVQLLDRGRQVLHRQVGEQLPPDRFAARRLPSLDGVEDGQRQLAVLLPLGRRRVEAARAAVRGTPVRIRPEVTAHGR